MSTSDLSASFHFSRQDLKSQPAAPQRRISFDDLYDATDESTDDSDVDGCPSLSSHGDTRSSTASYTNSSNRMSTGTNQGGGRRNRYPVIMIPPPTFNTIHQQHKNSPVPPTPPPKIPLSPMVLSRISGVVPALYAPPSLAGSAASERPSTLSAPQTPDLAAVPDVDWDEEQLRVQSDSEGAGDPRSASSDMSPQIDIQLEQPEDWSLVLDRFPQIPTHYPVVKVPEREGEVGYESEASLEGVQLSSAAMETLQHIRVPGEDSNASSASSVNDPSEMNQFTGFPDARPKSMNDAACASISSASSFTSLSIPSPGGFFSSLDRQARKTWSLVPTSNVPTSAVAEKFYDLPWNAHPQGRVIEQVVEYRNSYADDDDDATEGPPTAKRIIGSAPQTARKVPEEISELVLKLDIDEKKQDDASEYDESYEEGLQTRAMQSLDRTSTWLAAQTQYMAALSDTNPINSPKETPVTPINENTTTVPDITVSTTKTVRFLDTIPEESSESQSGPSTPLPPLPVAMNSIFYRGFQHFMRTRGKSCNLDTFLHSNYRYEAMQVSRLTMREKHVKKLAGKYELENPVRPPYKGPFSQAPRNSVLPQIIAEKKMYNDVEKEQDALLQVKDSLWVIDALRYINGGRLIPSPAAKRLAKTNLPLGGPQSSVKRRIRVLDLGGQASCEWSWFVAREFPSVRVYTIVTKKQSRDMAIQGPPNHQCVLAPSLWKLPFPDNHFDLISARTLHMLLQSTRNILVNGEKVDEFELCLQECFRCLKPRGYLEFFLMDSDIVRAGPYSSATSVEFAFNLKTRGYDPNPTKTFLWKLKKSNFGAIKRAWLFMPMGTTLGDASQVPGSRNMERGSDIGSTADVANITGLLVGWMWEQWMLKLQMEMGRDEMRLLEEMNGVFDEGRKSGAGWRCLSGWAMKPSRSY
ncbi:hypothetical protein TMEN_6467 [Trichophyton mentagrophytes]|uniref:Verprolin n=2 Tax=Trichophyton interdigitale TaxID=101480 RepID=A0A9P5CYA6_9EURO|nr:hypothetical protein H101_01867 [Trichophyton interdigitale H6]KAF3898086.1 Verprolin [Trichophyton interdigitale]KDB23256.1 hypothetical protein H109_04854 [Trichophyton interdigitale MR816]GBF63806.1 hypothetical protein TMEN_6467 [Trichophyton mentagrophytes]KAF3901271.1 Verprolin [Trichophyton interdigitale]